MPRFSFFQTKPYATFGVVACLVAAPYAVAQTAMPSPPLELIVLGSGGPGAVGRASTSLLLLVDGKARVLVDAGGGAFARLGEEGLSLRDLDIVLLTHLHVDHAAELPAIVKARAVSVGGPARFRVFGPDAGQGFPSTRRFVELMFGKRGAFAYLADFAAPLRFESTNLGKATAGREILSEGGLRIWASSGHHRDAPAVIYKVSYQGHSVTFSGDIDPAGHGALRALASGSNLLVFNTVVLDPPGSPQQLYALHTPPQAIGELARDAAVGQLLLTHLSPAVERNSAAVLASIQRNYAGAVTFAEDRQHITPP